MALCVPRIAGARVLGRGDHDSADTCYVHFRSAIGLTTRNRVAGMAPVCRRRPHRRRHTGADWESAKKLPSFETISLSTHFNHNTHAARHPKDSQ